MEQPVLTDKNQFPSYDIIGSYIGDSINLWDAFFGYIHTSHPDFTEQWRYYNDGKSWLLKVSRNSKTIFWLSVVKGAFRTTFYFTDKATESLENSSISKELKEKFKSGKKYNKIRGLRVLFRDEKDIEYAKELIAIKLRIK